MPREIRRAYFQIGAIALVLCSLSCGPQNTPPPKTTGTLIVDAEISGGTRFVVYCNDVWTAPERQAIANGQRKEYSFTLPSQLRSLRLDPSEAPNSRATIYSISIEIPGQPKKALPLTDLPKFIAYHCSVKLDGDTIKVDATGPDMYFMSTVDPATYPIATAIIPIVGIIG